MKIDVRLERRSYPVYIGAGILDQIGALCREQGLGRRMLLVSNETVGPLYAGLALKSLHTAGFTVHYAAVPDGEEHKNQETLGLIYDACLDAGLDRGSSIVALGGGVVGDMAGFAAATFMRGIDFVQAPTTLLAQVDASVGGKTGINHKRGKNMIGAFHQPRLVLADVSTLVTLPKREYTAGLAEVVKHGLIADRLLFEFCEREWPSLVDLKPEAVSHVIARSVEIKKAVVEVDEKEEGLRAILNFGHSVGHAIEAVTAYRTYTHGEAVALGMVVEARLSEGLGRLSSAEYERIVSVLRRLGLPVRVRDVPVAEVLQAMQADKKNRDGRLTLALLDGIGKADVVRGVDAELVADAYRSSIAGARE